MVVYCTRAVTQSISASERRKFPLSDKVSSITHIEDLLFDLIFLENVFGGQKSVEKMAWNVGIIPAVTTVLVSRQTTRRIA